MWQGRGTLLRYGHSFSSPVLCHSGKERILNVEWSVFEITWWIMFFLCLFHCTGAPIVLWFLQRACCSYLLRAWAHTSSFTAFPIFSFLKKKKWNKIIMKYGNENVSKTARVENTAKKRLSKEPSSYFRESARTKPRPRSVDRDTFFFYFISHRDDVIKIHDEHTLCDMELCLKHHGLVCKVQSVLAEGPSAGAGCEQAGLPAVEEEDKHWVCFD